MSEYLDTTRETLEYEIEVADEVVKKISHLQKIVKLFWINK